MMSMQGQYPQQALQNGQQNTAMMATASQMRSSMAVTGPGVMRPTTATLARRQHLERLVDTLYDNLEQDAQAVEYRRQKQARGFNKVQRGALMMKQKWQQLHMEKRKLQIERECFEAACKASWNDEAAGISLTADATTDAAGADEKKGEDAEAGTGEDTSKGSTDIEKPKAKAEEDLLDDTRRIKLNVGGQIFETTAGVLRKDSESKLAALTYQTAPTKAGRENILFFDRDWWLFRHVLHFLREGGTVLPSSRKILKELYKEAAFWRLPSLRQALRLKYKVVDDEDIAENALALGAILAPVDPLVTKSAFDSTLAARGTGGYGGMGVGAQPLPVGLPSGLGGYPGAGVGTGYAGDMGLGGGYGGPASRYPGGQGYGGDMGGLGAGLGGYGDPAMRRSMGYGGMGAPQADPFGVGGMNAGGLGTMGSMNLMGNMGAGNMNPLQAMGSNYGLGNAGYGGPAAGGYGRPGVGRRSMTSGLHGTSPYDNALDPRLVAYEKSFG